MNSRLNYRTEGPVEMQPVVETAAVVELSSVDPRIALGIISDADLMLGDAITPVLEAHIAAGKGRFRGVRAMSQWDPHPSFQARDPLAQTRLDDPRFREGLARLSPLGLSLDSFCFHPNLPQVARLAAAYPGTQIVLNHVGCPLGSGPHLGRPKEVFAEWRKAITPVAAQSNVVLKFGGLGNGFIGPPLVTSPEWQRSSTELAALWKPCFEVCLDLFGPARVMFESNFPVDRPNASYRTLWNAFKRLAGPLSPNERTALCSATAVRAYRLSVPPA